MENCYIEVTNKCNLVCKHCFNASGNGKTDEITISKIAEIIDTIVKTGVDKITITGGEIQLYSDLAGLLEVISKYPQQRFHFITNGTIHNEKFINFVNSNKNIWVGVSLDGVTSDTHDAIRGKGAFAKTLHFLDKLTSNRCILKFTINTLNKNEVEEFIDFAISRGYKPEIGSVIELGRAHVNWEDIGLKVSDLLTLNRVITKKANQYHIDKKELNIGMIHKCKLVLDDTKLFSINIKATGEVMPCGCLQSSIFSIGNVFTEQLHLILEDDNNKFKTIKQLLISRKELLNNNFCSQCIASKSKICPKDGGCPAMAEYSFLEPNYICDFRKRLAMYAFVSNHNNY